MIGSRRFITILFIIVGVFMMNIPFAVAKESLEVKSIKVSEKSSTITVEDIVFENNTINSKIYFNELNDFVTFDIELKNDTNNDYTLEEVTNNINSNYLVVESNNKGNILRKNTTDTIKVKIKYNNELVNHDDISLNDVSIGLVFSNPTINVNPLTNSNVLLILITVIVISILSFYAIKNKKSKLFLLLFLLIPTFVFAVEKTTVEIKFNDLNIKGRYLQYRVQVMDNDTSLMDTDITYGQEIGTLPDVPQRDGYNDNGWLDQHNNAVTSETVVTEDLVITADYNPIEYNITYNLNGGTLEQDNPNKYTVEDEFTLNNPTMEGYTFSGWTEGASGVLHTSVTIYKGTIGDKTFTAFYSPNQDTTYTVIHRQMNMNGEYEEFEREVLHGATGTNVTPQVKDYPGFTSPVEQTKSIDGDGKTTFTYDYIRNRYQFTVTDREYLDNTSTANGEYYYGTTITLKAQTRVGYDFEWSDGDTNLTRTFTLESDKTLTPRYTAKTNIQYKVVHKKMNLDGHTYSTADETTYYGTTGATIQPDTNIYEGFTAPRKETATINGDGSTVVEYLYERNKYNLTIEDSEWVETATPSDEYYYGTSITLRAKDRDEYTFVKWSNENTNVEITFELTGNTTIKPIYAKNSNVVTFNYNGGEGEETVRIVTPETSIGALPAGTRTNYYLDGWYTAPTDGTKIEATYVPTASIEIFARWKKSVEAMTINNPEITLNVEEEENIVISNANEIEEEYTFTSNDTNVASVDSDGKVTGVGVGNTTITITGIKSLKTKTINVTVLSNKYVITFNSNGGTVSEESREVTKGQPIGTLPTGEMDNNYLDGWYTSLTNGIKIEDSYVPEADMEIVAKWKKSIDVANITNENISIIKDATETINITNPSEIEEEYTFTSNNEEVATVDSNGVVTGVGVGNTTITMTGTSSNRTRTINVTVLSNQYVITFDSNGGTVSEETRPVTIGQAIGELPTGTKENKYLDGWYTSLDATGEKVNASYVPTGSITLVARWKNSIDVATIENTDISVVEGENETISITNASEIEEEYTFTSNNEEVATVDSNGVVTGVSEGTTTVTITGTRSHKTKTINVTVLSNQYVITFDANGGTVSEETRLVTIGQAIGELPTGTKENKYLDGWYTSLEATGEKVNASYVPTGSITLVARWKNSIDVATIENIDISVVEGENETISITNASEIEEEYTFTSNDEEVATVDSNGVVTGVSEGTTTVTITGSKSGHTKTINVTVTEAISNYIVTLDVNGGTMTGATTIEVVPGEAVGTLPTPTKSGSTFDHWRLTTETGTIITATYVPTSDITLVARWVPSDKVAEIDGTFFDTMIDAVNAVPTTGVQTTIRMINDFIYNDSSDQNFPAGTNIILDLNGHTVKNTGNAVVKNFGTLLIKDGTIQCSAGQGAVNNNKNCTLTLDNVTINSVGSRQAAYNKGGHMIVRNCTMTTTTSSQRPCLQNLNDGTTIGTMEIINSTITSPNSFGLYVEGGTVTIGQEDDNILSTPVITGQTYGVAAYGTVNFYDGILKGKTGAIGIAANTGNSPRMSVDTDHTKIIDIDDEGEYLEGTEGDYKTLTLQYKTPKYKVTLNASGGNVNPPEMNVTQGEAIGELPTPTREEYHFLGWYTGLTDGVEVTASYVPTADVEIFARWRSYDYYDVTFDKNNEDSTGTMNTQRILENTATPLSENQFTREGYAFVGWNTESDGSGTSYLDKANITLTGNTTLYAQWVKTYTLTFAKNNSDATGESYSITLLSGVSTLIPNDAFLAYDLEGNDVVVNYNTSSDNQGASYYRSQYITITEDTVLYAQWGIPPVSSRIYWAIRDDNSDGVNEKLIISDSEVVGNKTGNFAGDASFSTSPWYNDAKNVTNVEFEGTVVPTSTSHWFHSISRGSSTFYANLDNLFVSHVTDMSYMFNHTAEDANSFRLTGLNDWDTSNVTNMNNMFSTSGGYDSTTWEIGNLNNWDTSNVTDMSGLFSNNGCSSSEWDVGDLSNWKTSKVTNMANMFSGTGQSNASKIKLNLTNWDTSNVTNMAGMFSSSGQNATEWDVGDLSKWDVSKVTSLDNMFYHAATSTTHWSIGDLSDWDVSNVTNLHCTFASAGEKSSIWNIGNISHWNTSKVTNMWATFSHVGYSAESVNLDLSHWDTSNVTNMYYMFQYVGYNSQSISIDISSFNTSMVTNISDMFYYTGYNASSFSIRIPKSNGNGINNTTSTIYGSTSSQKSSLYGAKKFTLVTT